MANRTFRFINVNRLGLEAIVCIINEERVQSFAEANFGRKLSDIELHRFSNEVFNNDEASHALADLMSACIKSITNEKDTNWRDTDKLFLYTLPQGEREDCSEEHLEIRKGNWYY